MSLSFPTFPTPETFLTYPTRPTVEDDPAFSAFLEALTDFFQHLHPQREAFQ